MQELREFGRLLLDLNQTRKASEQAGLLRKVVQSRDSAIARLWHYTLNPYITYGISDVPADEPRVEYRTNYSVDWPGLIRLLDDLANRRITGNTAQYAVHWFNRDLQDAEARRGFTALIKRKPQCKVSVKKINSVFPGLIPEFEIALADSWTHSRDRALAMCAKGAYVDWKANGERRIFVHHLDGRVFFYSRGGFQDHNFPEHVAYLKACTVPGTVLDGEIVPLDNNFFTMGQFTKTKTTHAADGTVVYMVFDVLPIIDWVEQRSTIKQKDRTTWVQTADWGPGPVQAIQSWYVTSVEEMETIFYAILDVGGEGVIIKDPNAPYSFKRDRCWVKNKIESSVDLPILNVGPGKKGSKYEHTLGVLHCRAENGTDLIVSPGRMSEPLRNEVWANPNKFIGRIIEVGYQEMTHKGKLQFPRFYKFRPDKG